MGPAEQTKPGSQSGKIRLLAWGDYCCSTGFGTVMSNIMQQLQATGRYEIDVVAINYSGDPYDKTRWPGHVYPAMPGVLAYNGGPYADVYGRQRILDLVGANQYDVVFMLQDTFILKDLLPELVKSQQALAKVPGAKTFKTVFYFPIDATPKPEWAHEVVNKIDFPVAYTKYAREELAVYEPRLAGMPYIYHGTNLKDFFPINQKAELAAFRKAYFNSLADGKFLVTNINRNQPRKDIPRSLMILKELKDRGHNPLLYLHMQHSDIGGNVFVIAEQLGLENEKDFVCPHPSTFNSNQGIPIERLNLLYNISDCILTTTQGEGWGLSITEAFATKTPIVGPNNTSLTEIMAENRGALVPSGNTPSMWAMAMQDNERLRPIMDVAAAADAIEAIMNGKGPDIEAAYKWARALSWENICQQWVKIIDEAAAAAAQANKPVINRQQRRAMERKHKAEGQ